jgi:hypothetical protein
MADDNGAEPPPAKIPGGATGRGFQPGQSGNPGGKPKGLAEVQQLARAHTVTAINTLAQIASAAKAPPAARVSAAQALLDRGWGKPMQPMEHGGPGGGPVRLTWGDGST